MRLIVIVLSLVITGCAGTGPTLYWENTLGEGSRSHWYTAHSECAEVVGIRSTSSPVPRERDYYNKRLMRVRPHTGETGSAFVTCMKDQNWVLTTLGTN